MKIHIKAECFRHRLIGNTNLTISIRRKWNDNWPDQTWRHITIGLRSPVLIDTNPDRHRWFYFNPIRFGYLAANYYFGIIYIITTFRSTNLWNRNPYRRLGPFQWVWDDGRYRAGLRQGAAP